MGKILFWLVVGFLFWLVLRLALTRMRKSGTNDAQSEKNKPPQLTMAQCAYCGIHFPRSEGVSSEDGRVFCSQAHSDAAHRAS